MASNGREIIPYVPPPFPLNDLREMRQSFELVESATMVHVSSDGQPSDAATNEGCEYAKKGESEARDKLDKSSIIEVASSTSGEVKVILNCSGAIGKPNFQMPSLDEVVKLMEDKCHNKYKDLDPNFSVLKVMQDVCQCFVELAAKSTTNNSSINSSEATRDE